MPANILADSRGGIAQFARRGILSGTSPLVDAGEHAPQQIVIVLVAIGLGIEIVRHFGQPLVADALDVFLHETVIVAPGDAGGAHRRLLGAGRDLMGVQIMQAELVDQRLLDLFVQDEKAVGLDRRDRET